MHARVCSFILCYLQTNNDIQNVCLYLTIFYYTLIEIKKNVKMSQNVEIYIYCTIFRFKYVSPFLSKQCNKTEMING